MRSLAWSLATLLVTTPVLLLGCSKTNNVKTDNDTNNIYQKTIGSEGGPVGDTKGFGLYVPGQALGDDVEISLRIAEEGEYPALPPGAVGEVYSYEPHETELAAPGTFHLPFPEPLPSPIRIARADAGGAFALTNAAPDVSGSHIVFTGSRFGYFVIVDPMVPDANPMGKPGECPRNDDLPEGFITAQAGQQTVVDSNGAAVPAGFSSGYAVRDVVDSDTTRLQMVFGKETVSCTHGYSAGGSEDLLKDPIGRGGSENLVVQVLLAATTPGTPEALEPDTAYPRTDSADAVRSALVVLDPECKPNPPFAEQGLTIVTIATIDDQGVTGTLHTEDAASGASMTANFNLEYCPLPSPPVERCCP